MQILLQVKEGNITQEEAVSLLEDREKELRVVTFIQESDVNFSPLFVSSE